MPHEMPAVLVETAVDHDAGLVDVNTCYGPVHGRLRGSPLAELVSERRRHGVYISLARSLLAISADEEIGNRDAFLSASDPANGIRPVAVVWPRGGRNAARVVKAAREGGAVACWLQDPWFPLADSSALTDALAEIARFGRPLFVPVETGQGGVAGINATTIGRLTSDLGIAVILVGVGYRQISEAIAAARQFPHLHFDTSRLAQWRGVETLTQEIGAARVLFGSGGPRGAAASGINSVLLADIDAGDKREILAGNAVRLFDLPRAEIDLPKPWLPERSWDVHTHLGPTPVDTPRVGDLAGEMRRFGTRVSVASSGFGIFGDPQVGNDEVVAESAASGSVRGYLLVDPTDMAFSREQVERHGGRDGIVGIKIHAEWSGCPTSSKPMSDLFAYLARYGRPVLIHNSGPDWDRGLIRIARKHPELPIIIAHGGLGAPSEAAGRVASSAENVYVELASSIADIVVVRKLVELAGPDRLLWGSDATLLNPAFVLGTYRDANLDPAWLERVFWTNAERIFSV